VQVDSEHPVHVTPAEGTTIIVKSLGTPILYKEDPAVSATNKTGELTKGQTLTIERQSGYWFIAEEGGAMLEIEQQPVEQIIGGEIVNETITAKQVKKETLVGNKLANATVEPKQVKPATTPVAGGTEGEVILGTSGVTRTIKVAWTAKHEATPKIKIKHGLATGYVTVTAYKAAAKVPVEQIAIEKVVYKSTEEIEVTLTAEPAAKEEIFFVVSG
jgi:hypothetical protein